MAAAESVGKRVVVHFPGFEPLNAAAHYERFERTAAQSADVWNCRFDIGPLQDTATAACFEVVGSGPNWRTDATVFILEHHAWMSAALAEPRLVQLPKGYAAFVKAIALGGLWGYLRHAWRFAVFCLLYPFVIVGIGIVAALALAALPWLLGFSAWHILWSLPLGAALFWYVHLPWTDRFHALLLFSDWRFAVAMATLDDAAANRRLAECEVALRAALDQPADEYVITSHSMGTILAAHALGAILQSDPDALAGKRVIFATLGGALLQSALLRPAVVLRERAGLVLRAPQVYWFDVQSLNDPIHFYKSNVARALGHDDTPTPQPVFFRLKNILTPERYKRVKRDVLRIHRQYVLGLDRRGPFDFTLLAAGPLPAASFARFTQHALPPIGDDGAMLRPTVAAA